MTYVFGGRMLNTAQFLCYHENPDLLSLFMLKYTPNRLSVIGFAYTPAQSSPRPLSWLRRTCVFCVFLFHTAVHSYYIIVSMVGWS